MFMLLYNMSTIENKNDDSSEYIKKVNIKQYDDDEWFTSEYCESRSTSELISAILKDLVTLSSVSKELIAMTIKTLFIGVIIYAFLNESTSVSIQKTIMTIMAWIGNINSSNSTNYNDYVLENLDLTNYLQIFLLILVLLLYINLDKFLDFNKSLFEEKQMQIKYTLFLKSRKAINIKNISDIQNTINEIINNFREMQNSFKSFTNSLSKVSTALFLPTVMMSTYGLFQLYFVATQVMNVILAYKIINNENVPLEKEIIDVSELSSNLFNASISLFYSKGYDFSKNKIKKYYKSLHKKNINISTKSNSTKSKNDWNVHIYSIILYIIYFTLYLLIFFIICRFFQEVRETVLDPIIFALVKFSRIDKVLSLFVEAIRKINDKPLDFNIKDASAQIDELYKTYIVKNKVLMIFYYFPYFLYIAGLGALIFYNNYCLNNMNYCLLQIFTINNKFECLKYPLHGSTYDIKTIDSINFKNFECFFMDGESDRNINLKMNELNRLNELHKRYMIITDKTPEMKELIKEAPTKIENLKISIEELIKKSKIKKITNLINVKIDFAKNGGSYVMVIGETGCGKSTLISYFLRILEDNEKYLKYLNKTKEEADELSEDDNGIFINDKILSACNENLKNNIYTIIQQPSKNLIASWNVRTNILFEHASKINNNDNNNESSEGKIYEKILNATCKIACFNSKHSSLNNLSGGEQQRLSIASTFAKWLIKVKEQIGEEKLDEILNILNNFDCEDWEKQFKLEEIDLFDELYESPLFIFDEITSALDINTAKKIIKQIHILRNIFNLHIIEITHSPHNAILKDNDTILQFNKEIKDDIYTLRQSTVKEFLNTNQNNKS